jgi:hypothetical protein
LFRRFAVLGIFFSTNPLKASMVQRYPAAMRQPVRYTLDFDALPTSLPSPYRFQTAIQDRKQ